MKCAVANCRSDNHSKASNCSFYIFPSNTALAKNWVKFCRREDYFNPKTSFICMKHFTRDDFENSLQYEMGYARNRLLKRGVVPTIYEQPSEGSEIRATSLQSPNINITTEQSTQENLEIIRLVKINPLVYTSASKKVRQEIWEKIDETCGFKIPESRKRWEQLLSDFCMHILNVTKKKQPKNGLATAHIANIKIRDYCYFKDMLFILPFLKSIVGNANIKAIQEEIKNEGIQYDNDMYGNMAAEVKLEQTDTSDDMVENNETPSTSKSSAVTCSTKAHRDYVTMNDINKTPIEIKIDNNIYKIEMSTTDYGESPHCGDFIVKENKKSSDRCNSQQTCSAATTTTAAKTTLTTTGTMTDRKLATPYEHLSPEEQSLKAFFDAMLHATQRLPEFHQRRIKGDLVKALRHQGVDIVD